MDKDLGREIHDLKKSYRHSETHYLSHAL